MLGSAEDGRDGGGGGSGGRGGTGLPAAVGRSEDGSGNSFSGTIEEAGAGVGTGGRAVVVVVAAVEEERVIAGGALTEGKDGVVGTTVGEPGVVVVETMEEVVGAAAATRVAAEARRGDRRAITCANDSTGAAAIGPAGG